MTLLITGGNRDDSEVEVDVAQGKLFTWGRNDSGNNADGTTTSRSSPVQVGSNTNWIATSMSAGEGGLALNSAGKLYAVGDNDQGQLADGSTTDTSTLAQVGAQTDWAALGHNAQSNGIRGGVKATGKLYTWGDGALGGTGHGNTTDISSPVQVGALTTWVQLATAWQAMSAIKSDGTLWTWGRGGYGILGHGNTTDLSSPVQVGAQTDWSIVLMGFNSSFGLKTSGKLYSWGQSNVGQLGHGNTTAISSPVQIGAQTDWSAIAAGTYGIWGFKTTGKVYSWGKNNLGQLGNGGTANTSSPVQIGSLTNWVSGSYNSAMHTVKLDGSLWACGRNATHGYLGVGDTTNRSSPVQVGALTTWKRYSMAKGHTAQGIRS